MSPRTHTHPTSAPLRGARSLLAAFALTILTSIFCHAPALAIDELTWTNGLTLKGSLVSADTTSLQWHPAAFLDAAPFHLYSIRSLSFDANPTRTLQPWAIYLRDGSRIHGDISSLNDSYLTISSPIHGQTRLRRSELAFIQRVNGGSVVYAGPSGKTGWTDSTATQSSNREELKKITWQAGSGGTLSTGFWNSRATLDITPPEICEIDLRLSSRFRPEFALQIAAKDHAVLSLDTWDDELVLVLNGHFAPLRTLTTEDRQVELRIVWDRKNHRYAAFALDGTALCDWQTYQPPSAAASRPGSANSKPDPADPFAPNRAEGADPFGDMDVNNSFNRQPTTITNFVPTQNGLRLTNRSPHLVLDRLVIRRGSGEAPAKVTPGHPYIIFNDGRTQPLSALSIANGQATFASASISLSELERIQFQLPELHLAPASNTEILLADASQLNGRLQSADANILRLVTSFTDEPISVQRKPLSEVRFSISPPSDAPPLPTLEEADVLTYGPGKNDQLPGRFSPSGSNALEWLPIGGVRPVKLLPSSNTVITRALPSDGKFPRTPAWLHLVNGDIIPVKPTSLDRQQIQFEAPLLGVRHLPSGLLSAMQIAGPEVKLAGFEDSGWSLIKGEAKDMEIKDKYLTLKPGAAYGHPSLMQGREVHLCIKSSQTPSTIRLRLFTDRIDPESPHLPLVIAQYGGNQVYIGIEEPPGQMREQISTAVNTNKENQYRIIIHDQEVEVFVNDSAIGRFSNLPQDAINGRRRPLKKVEGADKEPSPTFNQSGLGVILEPANLWGNGDYAVTIGEFSIRPDPANLSIPQVSPDSRQQALQVPRLQQNDPPSHVLIATNGDLLRGQLESATAEHLGFRTGMERHAIPLDRVSAAIWLRKAPEPVADGKKDPPPPPGTLRIHTISIPKNPNDPSLSPNLAISDPPAPQPSALERRHANDLRRRILAGEDFATIAKAVSRDDKAAKGGDWGPQFPAKLPGVMGIVATRLQPGEVSHAFDNGSHYVILRSDPCNTPPVANQEDIIIDIPDRMPYAHRIDQFLTGVVTYKRRDLSPSRQSEHPSDLPLEPTHHLHLLDGSQFQLSVQRFEPDAIIGHSELFGDCRIPLTHLYKLRPVDAEKKPGVSRFDEWKLVFTPAPAIPEAGAQNSPLIGKAADKFTLPLLSGGDFKLEDHKGKVVVLDFWATWCAPCIKSLPEIIELMSQAPPEKAVFIGVNQGEPPDQIKTFLERRQWQFPVVLDSAQHIGQKFGVEGIPHTVVVDQEGKIAWVQTGYSATTAQDLAQVLTKLLGGG